MGESGRIFGYARVSSKDQNLDRQLEQLKQYVQVENILQDKASGKDLNRPSYQALKGALGLRPGDTLYVVSLDRISRNKSDLKNELQWFKEHGIRLKILDLPTSLITVPDGQQWIIEMVENILIEVIGSIAEQERMTIRKRQREGIDAAKSKGKHLGRPRIEISKEFVRVYEHWRQGHLTAREAMARLNMTESRFYRKVKEYEEQYSVSKGPRILANLS